MVERRVGVFILRRLWSRSESPEPKNPLDVALEGGLRGDGDYEIEGTGMCSVMVDV